VRNLKSKAPGRRTSGAPICGQQWAGSRRPVLAVLSQRGLLVGLPAANRRPAMPAWQVKGRACPHVPARIDPAALCAAVP